MVFAAAEPVTVNAVVRTSASRFSKLSDRNAVADGLVRTRGDREVDRGDAARGRQHQRVGSAAAVDRGFRAVIGDRVVAAAGRDHVGSAAAVDGVVAATAGNDVCAGRAGDRDAGRQQRCIDILEIGDVDASRPSSGRRRRD